MQGFKPAQAAQHSAKTKPRAGSAKGGMVRGPGTGVSDEVPDQVPEGSYIMPADSTQAVGAEQLQGLGAKNIPVNLSNGEFKLPPEQVHAVGVQALDQMKDATHAPVAAQGEGPELFFAGGGMVRDPNRPDIPMVGTRGPVRGGGGGGLGQDAVAAARTAAPQPQPRAAGIAGLTANPVTNPQGVLRERERMAGLSNYAGGGVVTEDDERKQQAVPGAPGVVRSGNAYSDAPAAPAQAKPNFFPGNSPDAGANVYGGAGVALGSSGKLANVPAGIGGNPGRSNSFGDAAAAAANPAVTQSPTGIPMASQNTDSQRKAMVNQIPRDVGPQAAAAPQPAPAMAQPPAARPSVLQTDPQAAADRASFGGAWNAVKGASEDAGRAMLDVATMVPRGAVGAYDSAVIRPMRAAGINAGYLSQHLVPDGVDPASMTPFTDQKRMQQPASAQAPAQAQAAAVQPAAMPPIGQPAPVMPVAPATPSAGPAPASTPAPDQVMPGIYRQGNSYSDQAPGVGAQPSGMPAQRSPVGMSVEQAQKEGLISERVGYNPAYDQRLTGANTGQPNAQNMAAAQALSDRGQQQALAQGFNPAQASNWQAPTVRNSTNDWASRKALENAATAASSITADGGRFDSRRGTAGGGKSDRQVLPPSGKQAAYGAMLANDLALQGAQPNMDQAAMRERGADGRAAMQQQGENQRSDARNQIEGQRVQNEKGRYDLEGRAKGFDIRQAERMERLQNEYLAAQNDPKKAEGIAQKMRVLAGGKGADDANWGVQVTPATKNADGSTSEGSVIRYNKSTGAVEYVNGQQGAQPKPQPKTAAEAVAGQVYQTARGPMRWDGKQFTPL